MDVQGPLSCEPNIDNFFFFNKQFYIVDMGPTKDKNSGVKAKGKEVQRDTGVEESGEHSSLVEDVSHDWQESVNDAVEEVMIQRGESMPPMVELLKDVQKITEAFTTTSHIPGGEEDGGFAEAIQAQIKQIEGENVTPTQARKPVFSDPPKEKEYKGVEYQESFTSQQETAELREEVSSLASRLVNLEAILEGLVQERKHLPEHLARLTSGINAQFTIMNDRLSAAIESGIAPESAQQLSEQVVEMTSSSTKVLETLTEDLQSTPTTKSQVSQTRPITGKKKKVRLVK
jgi:hypothetical protein